MVRVELASPARNDEFLVVVALDPLQPLLHGLHGRRLPATTAKQIEGFDQLREQDEVGSPCRRSRADVPGEYRQRRVGSSGVPASSVFGPSRGDAFKDSFVLPDKASEKLEGISNGDL